MLVELPLAGDTKQSLKMRGECLTAWTDKLQSGSNESCKRVHDGRMCTPAFLLVTGVKAGALHFLSLILKNIWLGSGTDSSVVKSTGRSS